MRVLVLCSELGVGGQERQLALLLPALRERGFDSRVVALRGGGRYLDELADAGIPTAVAGMRSRYDLRGLRRALAEAGVRDGRGPEIVFTDSVNAQVVGAYVARRSGAVHVTVEHAGIGLGRAPHRRALVRLFGTTAARVVAVSSSQIPGLEALGYRRERIVVVPNGIADLDVPESAAGLRERLGLSASDFVALLVAGMRPEKRPSFFLDAIAAARGSDDRIVGVLAGGGELLEEVAERANSVAGVRVLGERADVPALIAASDVVCLSSSHEGLPVSVLEAMALARPVVATNVGGLSEAVVEGTTGFLVDPADPGSLGRALARLAEDGELAAELGRAGRRRFEERFTLARMADGYAAVFRSADARQS